MEKDWDDFLTLCSKIKSDEGLRKFIRSFFDTRGKRLLASRYVIIKAILEEN
jgi:Trp operon repressor